MTQTKKWWLKKIAHVLLIGLSLFVAAGTHRWTMAWGYVFINMSLVIINRNVLHPELLSERSMRINGTIKWDLLTAPFVTSIGPLILYLIAGLDKRYGWSMMPSLIQFLALILLLIGTLIGTWTIKSNIFYSETVRIQYERRHVVITDGPYRFIRHPGYLGCILASFATPLMLGSWVALFPSAILIFGYLSRTYLEDVTLQRQFKGYYDYTKKVPYRLFPGIW